MNTKRIKDATRDKAEPVVEKSADLTDAERTRIRSEMRYAAAVLNELRPPKHEGPWERVGAFLNNGFVLLLIGAGITSIAVPLLQRAHDQKKQNEALMAECRSEFLLYANSIWEEFYLIHTLVSETSITKAQYDAYAQKISEVTLRRYNAFAKLQSVALVFRSQSDKQSEVETMLEDYAISVNEVSRGIGTWLRRLYCYTAGCDNEAIEVDYSSYDAFVQLRDKLESTELLARKVSEAVIKHIKGEK